MARSIRVPEALNVPPQYSQAVAEYLTDIGAAILYMKPRPRPCFTMPLLRDIRRFQLHTAQRIRSALDAGRQAPFQYIVLASGLRDTFSLGGDLNLFVELNQSGDRQALSDYAVACIDDAYGFCTNLDLPVTSIALLQGNAQGGGFEAALSCNVIIAERGTFMGFPEVLFNLFPGMGAYPFLARRVGPALAERLIFSGDLYPAEYLHELGVIDLLADKDGADEKLREYIRAAGRRGNALGLFRHMRSTYQRVSYDELYDVTQRWVDAALQLSEGELRTMLRLVRAQDRKMARGGPAAPGQTDHQELA
ncbi:MAG TPA: crotonase/enoyl-CoA hydratase family protein [Gammaproteobacteria bacterium]|nr:crotonase/enoyl-CoA hydratase family protein [Gammaproteobacteria bacterium]